MSDYFLIAAEISGDHLGGSLMQALKRKDPEARFFGVGGPAMKAEGLDSLFPISDLAVMGFSNVIRNLSRIRARIRETAEAIVRNPPDAIVMIDSYGFSAQVGKRVRKLLPRVPIIKYVSPQVWAWRQGRAKKMRGYFDHVLTLFPFEPKVLRELGGPPSTYVGHPLMERLHELRPSGQEQARRDAKPPLLLVMPGSRRAEIASLSDVFGDALGMIAKQYGEVEVVLPTLPHVLGQVEAASANWPIKPRIVIMKAEKLAAIRNAHAAIAASGTASLELALAHVPHVGAYKVRAWEAFIVRRLVRVSNVLLPNLLLGETVVPEFLQEDCTAGNIADAAIRLLRGGEERERQAAAFGRMDAILETGTSLPSERAAAMVMELLDKSSRAGR